MCWSRSIGVWKWRGGRAGDLDFLRGAEGAGGAEGVGGGRERTPTSICRRAFARASTNPSQLYVPFCPPRDRPETLLTDLWINRHPSSTMLNAAKQQAARVSFARLSLSFVFCPNARPSLRRHAPPARGRNPGCAGLLRASSDGVDRRAPCDVAARATAGGGKARRRREEICLLMLSRPFFSRPPMGDSNRPRAPSTAPAAHAQPLPPPLNRLTHPTNTPPAPQSQTTNTQQQRPKNSRPPPRAPPPPRPPSPPPPPPPPPPARPTPS